MKFTRRMLISLIPFMTMADSRVPWEVYRDEVGDLSFKAVRFVSKLRPAPEGQPVWQVSEWAAIYARVIIPAGYERVTEGVVTRDMISGCTWRNIAGAISDFELLWLGPSFYLGHRIGTPITDDTIFARKVQ